MSEQPATEICTHDWEPFWDGSLGYSATDKCWRCGSYRPATPTTDEHSGVFSALGDEICHPYEEG